MFFPTLFYYFSSLHKLSAPLLSLLQRLTCATTICKLTHADCKSLHCTEYQPTTHPVHAFNPRPLSMPYNCTLCLGSLLLIVQTIKIIFSQLLWSTLKKEKYIWWVEINEKVKNMFKRTVLLSPKRTKKFGYLSPILKFLLLQNIHFKGLHRIALY